MPVGPSAALLTADSLERELDAHLEEVQELYDRLIRAHKPIYYSPVPAEPSSAGAELPSVLEQRPVASTNLDSSAGSEGAAAGGDVKSGPGAPQSTIASSIFWKK